MRRFVRIIGVLFSYIIPYKIPHILNAVKTTFFNGYYSRMFKEFGEGSTIVKPMILRNLDHVSVGKSVSILHNSTITAITDYMSQRFDPVIRIGDNCSLGKYIHITSINSIELGDNVLIGNYVTVTDHSHGMTNDLESLPPIQRPLYSKGKVVIEDDVWIGDKCTILPGVTIGKGSIVGANTVVVKNVPPYSVVIGSAGSIK